MMTLEEALAEVKAGNVRRWGGVDTKPEAVATIINAAASGNLIPVQCCMCGKKDLSIVEGDGGQECELADGRWTCSSDCWEKATADLIPKADHDLAEALAYRRADELCERVATGYEVGGDAAIGCGIRLTGGNILALAPADALAEVARLREALGIAGPIALADFENHPFILNDEETRKRDVIRAALTTKETP